MTIGTIALPTGARSIVFQFNADAHTGDSSDNAYLDDAFVTLSVGSGPQQAVPGIGANYLTNPGFENGLDGWTASPGSAAAAVGEETGYPAAYGGSSYYAAGAVQQGTVSQTVNLLSSGLTATQIDAGGLNLVFGGRVISGNAFPPDQGQIEVTMLAANGTTVLGTSTVQAPNTTDRWALAGGTTALLAGTRFVEYTFTSTRQSGETFDESFLDDAFVSTTPIGVASPDGAYQVPAVVDPTTGAAQIALTSPVLYTNWVDNVPHTITWSNFGNAGASNQSVQITLYQETPLGTGLPSEPKLLKTITAGTSNIGSYTWIPTPATVPYGTYGLLVKVSLVGGPGVFDRTTETFTVPENGSTYYVNDGSTANDQYTTAPGSNRNDGKLPSQPLPNIDNVLREYSLVSGSVIKVDPGSYSMIDPFEVSGSLNYGLGIDQGFTVQGPTNGFAAVLTPANPDNASSVNLIQLEDANFVTINNLTLTGAGRGIYVQDSTNFSATGLTISNMANEGVRIDTNATVTLLHNLTVTNSGLAGIYISGTTGTISGADVSNSGTSVSSYNAGQANEDSGLYVVGPVAAVSGTFDDNLGWGIYLSDPGAVSVTDSTVFGNLDGIYVDGGNAVIGDPLLTDNAGNVVHDNTGYGIFATGSVTVTGNVVYDEAGANSFAIEVQAGATATENVAYASRIGIVDDSATLVSANRVYDNAQIGVDDIADVFSSSGTVTITNNVIYSNGIGIDDQRYYPATAVRIANNLIYANGTAAISITGQNGVSIVNNTIDQPLGDGIDIAGSNTGTQLRNNIIVIGSGIGINVAANSESGFASDYNLFYIPSSSLVGGSTGAIGEWEGVLQLSLLAWQATTGADPDSFTANPDFVNPGGAEGVLGYVSPSQPGYDDDFHLQSKYQDFRGGGLAPIIGTSGKPVFPTIVGGTDQLQSPGIDRGSPSDSYANEPQPNGGYINLGNYGDTAQASESPSQYILVLTPEAGATVQEGTSTTVTWRAFGFTGAVDLSYSANGTTFTTIATGVADSGSYTWAVPAGLTPGSTYVIQVSGVSASVSGLSQTFSVFGKITDYYVSPTGSDGNNGLTPSTPKASVQGLLAAYTLGAGDIIFVASGTYTVTTPIDLTSGNSGTGTSDAFTITGPTSGPAAVFDRGNFSAGQDVFDIQRGSYITIEHLTVTGAFNGIEIGGASAGVQLLNDTVTGNADVGILVDVNSGGTATAVTGLVIENDSINGNGLDGNGNYYGGNQDGVLVQQGNGGVQFLNDQVFRNNEAGLYLQDGYSGAGPSTIDGGAYYEQAGLYGGTGNGIVDDAGSLIEDTQVYANQGDGIYSNNNAGYSTTAPGTVTGNSVFGNRDAGIEAHTAQVTDNLVYSQISTSRAAIELNASTGLGNTVYGSTSGIFVGGSSTAQDNVVYDITGDGIFYTSSPPTAITGNTVYGAPIGISGVEYYTGPIIPITGNLIYENATAGISLTNGLDQDITNNTIYELTGTGIAIGGNAVSTEIENNIIAMASGPAITVAPGAESGFGSDYNLFDVGNASTVAGSTVGTIGVWEGVAYTDLATWYYELGLDQHSQVGNADFVAPGGSGGIVGIGTPVGEPVFYSPAYAPNLSAVNTPFSVPIQQLNSINAVAGGSLQLTGTWTPVYYSGNSFTVPQPGTVVVTNGLASTTTTTQVTYTYETNGFATTGTYTITTPRPCRPILCCTRRPRAVPARRRPGPSPA